MEERLICVKKHEFDVDDALAYALKSILQDVWRIRNFFDFKCDYKDVQAQYIEFCDLYDVHLGNAEYRIFMASEIQENLKAILDIMMDDLREDL